MGKTDPSSLVPLVCGAVKILETQKRSAGRSLQNNITGVDELQREGLQLARDTMECSSPKRILEMTPNGNFRFKIVPDTQKDNELAPNLYGSSSTHRTHSTHRKTVIGRPKNKQNRSTISTGNLKSGRSRKGTQSSKRTPILKKVNDEVVKPPPRIQKIIDRKILRKKERKIKPKMVSFDQKENSNLQLECHDAVTQENINTTEPEQSSSVRQDTVQPDACVSVQESSSSLPLKRRLRRNSNIIQDKSNEMKNSSTTRQDRVPDDAINCEVGSDFKESRESTPPLKDRLRKNSKLEI